jgi:organic hydroperoxide reductase OsmC/OhrA
MSYKHLFKAKLKWDSDRDSIASNTKNLLKVILIEGKELLHVSAAKAFKGDPELYNPEDLLLSSIVSVI